MNAMFAKNNNSILNYIIILLITGLFIFAVMYYSIYCVHTVEPFASTAANILGPASINTDTGEIDQSKVAIDVITLYNPAAFVAMTVVKGFMELDNYLARVRARKREREREAERQRQILLAKEKEEREAGVKYTDYRARDGSPIDVLKHSKFRR